MTLWIWFIYPCFLVLLTVNVWKCDVREMKEKKTRKSDVGTGNKFYLLLLIYGMESDAVGVFREASILFIILKLSSSYWFFTYLLIRHTSNHFWWHPLPLFHWNVITCLSVLFEKEKCHVAFVSVFSTQSWNIIINQSFMTLILLAFRYEKMNQFDACNGMSYVP